MIKTRIASAAAVFTFGMGALGGTVVAIAAPANATPGASGTTSTSDTSTTPESTVGFQVHLPKHIPTEEKGPFGPFDGPDRVKRSD